MWRNQKKIVEDSIRIYKRVEDLQNEIAQLDRQYKDLESTHEALLTWECQGNTQATE